eukprot:scaffold284914_cov32-Tisochrysis_lutea.AAC.7
MFISGDGDAKEPPPLGTGVAVDAPMANLDRLTYGSDATDATNARERCDPPEIRTAGWERSKCNEFIPRGIATDLLPFLEVKTSRKPNESGIVGVGTRLEC